MDTIAFLIGPYSIYWSTIMIALASAVGVLLFWCFYLWDGTDRPGAFLLVPLSLVLGILGEYLGRVFEEVKHRPLYLIARGKPKDEEF